MRNLLVKRFCTANRSGFQVACGAGFALECAPFPNRCRTALKPGGAILEAKSETMSDTPKTLIEFPADFPIKVMGEQHPEFAATVLNVVREHAPDTEEKHLTIRDSSGGNYLGCTVTVRVENQEQLDNLYRALTAHPMVKVVL